MAKCPGDVPKDQCCKDYKACKEALKKLPKGKGYHRYG